MPRGISCAERHIPSSYRSSATPDLDSLDECAANMPRWNEFQPSEWASKQTAISLDQRLTDMMFECERRETIGRRAACVVLRSSGIEERLSFFGAAIALEQLILEIYSLERASWSRSETSPACSSHTSFRSSASRPALDLLYITDVLTDDVCSPVKRKSRARSILFGLKKLICL